MLKLASADSSFVCCPAGHSPAHANPPPNLCLGGDIPRLKLALAPDTDNVKIVQFDNVKEVPKDDIEVTFKNLEAYLGTPAPCRIFLGKVVNAEKPAPYWLVKATADKDDANMEEYAIEIAVSTSAMLNGRFADSVESEVLRTAVEPEGGVTVTLPILVNTKRIPVTRKLFVFKEHQEEEDKTPKEVQNNRPCRPVQED